MSINKHILFYSNKCQHCSNLISLIQSLGTKDNYKYISVDDPNLKLPDIIEKVPTLIVKGMNKPLVGKEVFTWISSQQYINLETNNITSVKNPYFKPDATLSNTIDINYISLTDNDDELNKKIVKFNKLNEIFITEDINKIIKDNKINKELQEMKFSQLLTNRTSQIDSILNSNKQFSK
jgi:hypothetical protein